MNQTPGIQKQAQPLGLRRHAWLTAQIDEWTRDSVISAEQARAIAGRYESTQQIMQRRGMQAFIALCALAVLMFAAAVLLLVGYNWDAIGRATKVALIMAGVAGLFAGSAAAYDRGRLILGELLMLGATLAFGIAIWLLAQVYHIESHYPQGVLWWMIGALFAAYLVRSRLAGLEAAVLLIVWTNMEVHGFGRPVYGAIVAFAAVVLLAYRLKSVLVLLAALVAGSVWQASLVLGPWHGDWLAIPMLVLLGCMWFGIGQLHAERDPLGRTWRFAGIAIVLALLLPLTFDDWFRELRHVRYYGASDAEGLVRIVWIGAVMGAVISVCLVARWRTLVRDWPIAATAVAAGGVLVAWCGGGEVLSDWSKPLAYGFNALALTLAVWLIVRGVRLDRGLSYFSGVLYALVLVLVRWIELIGDMLSSAAMFAIAGLAMVLAAWFWRKRIHLLHEPAIKEVDHA